MPKQDRSLWRIRDAQPERELDCPEERGGGVRAMNHGIWAYHSNPDGVCFVLISIITGVRYTEPRSSHKKSRRQS